MKWHLRAPLDDERSGTIVVTPESLEDMWAVYNLIDESDRVSGSTFRKVVRESASGASSSDRVAMRLAVRVTEVDFDADAGVIRVMGRNETEHDLIKMGAYHTLELEPHRTFDVEKGSVVHQRQHVAGMQRWPISNDEKRTTLLDCRYMGRPPL